MLIVNVHPPHEIREVDSSSLRAIFGFHSSNLIGQNITRLLGPESDSVRLQDAIARAGRAESIAIDNVLYTYSGVEKRCKVY